MKYEARVRIAVTRTYDAVLETEDLPFFGRERGAEAWLRHFALGLRQVHLDRLAQEDERVRYEGEETSVLEIGTVEEVEEDRDSPAEHEETTACEDRAWGEFAARDPEGALRELQRIEAEGEDR
jgi:hypothetical protein